MIEVINKIINTSKGLDTLPLRFAGGVIFLAHGDRKLFALFSGGGLDSAVSEMASFGLEPAFLMAILAGSVEFFGAMALLVGALVRPVAFMLTITMIVAIVAVHLNNGLFIASGGYEFALALLAISVALTYRGAGSLSFDYILQSKIQKNT